MTQPATPRRAGPFSGNGVTTSFPFSFKVFDETDIAVVFVDADGIESSLVLNSDYSVTLNPDQEVAPGGAVTYPVSGTPLAPGETLSIVGALPYDQVTDLPTGGSYRAQVIENALDRTVQQIQQLAEIADRTLTLPASVDPDDVSAQLPAPEALNVIGWNETATALQNFDPSTFATIVAFGTAQVDLFSGDGAETEFVLTDNPGVLGNLDVAVDGVTQRPGIDFTWDGGTTLTFIDPPPVGTNNVLARYMQGLPQGYTDSAASTFVQAGTGAVPTVVQTKLREVYSFTDFGPTGLGVDDDTLALQRAIDAAPDGSTIHAKPEAVYKLSKNGSLLPVVYANGDAPCLVIYQRSGLTLDGQGATLRVDAHGQGAIDVLESAGITIKNFKIAGPGNFPPIDGTTGRAEKGTVGAGFYNASAVANGPPRNNSQNTSALNTGGYGGAFPQFGGGTAATWGTWNGGYLTNTGSGIFIGKGSTDTTVQQCEIYGFNEDGIQVDSSITEFYGWSVPARVYLRQNHIHDNYNAGIEYHRVSDLHVENNSLVNNGHPSASIAHTDIDPGYGVASNNGTASTDIFINFNRATGNKRKGIDAHSVDGLNVIGNIVADSGYGIMLVNGSLGGIRNIVCSFNQVTRIAYPVTAQAAGIYIERNASGDAGFAGHVSVVGNIITEVGVPPASTALYPGATPAGLGLQLSGNLEGVTASGNVIDNPTYFGFIGLCVGFAGADAIKGVFSGNDIRGKWANGLNNASTGGTGSSTTGNNIELAAIAPTYGVAQIGINGALDRMLVGNNVTMPTAGQTKVSGAFLGVQVMLTLSLAAGVLTATYGPDAQKYITSVATDPLGIRVTLNGCNAVSATFSQASSAKAITGGVTPLDYIYTDYGGGIVFLAFQVTGVAQNGNNCTGVFKLVINV